MALNFLFELLISAFIVVGGVFSLVGSFGLARLPDLMTRLHGPTKSATLGVGAMLIGSMIFTAWFERFLPLQELLITLFLFLTAPITANFIAKSFLHGHADQKRRLPPTGTDYGWASFDAPPETGDEEPDSLAGPRRGGG